jgi:hypothetical protein
LCLACSNRRRCLAAHWRARALVRLQSKRFVIKLCSQRLLFFFFFFFFFLLLLSLFAFVSCRTCSRVVASRCAHFVCVLDRFRFVSFEISIDLFRCVRIFFLDRTFQRFPTSLSALAATVNTQFSAPPISFQLYIVILHVGSVRSCPIASMLYIVCRRPMTTNECSGQSDGFWRAARGSSPLRRSPPPHHQRRFVFASIGFVLFVSFVGETFIIFFFFFFFACRRDDGAAHCGVDYRADDGRPSHSLRYASGSFLCFLRFSVLAFRVFCFVMIEMRAT